MVFVNPQLAIGGEFAYFGLVAFGEVVFAWCDDAHHVHVVVHQADIPSLLDLDGLYLPSEGLVDDVFGL